MASTFHDQIAANRRNSFLMAALVVRTLVYGDTVFWSLLWETGPAEWLPFLVPITVLVFFLLYVVLLVTLLFLFSVVGWAAWGRRTFVLTIVAGLGLLSSHPDGPGEDNNKDGVANLFLGIGFDTGIGMP